jgi:hypothetical protein
LELRRQLLHGGYAVAAAMAATKSEYKYLHSARHHVSSPVDSIQSVRVQTFRRVVAILHGHHTTVVLHEPHRLFAKQNNKKPKIELP